MYLRTRCRLTKPQNSQSGTQAPLASAWQAVVLEHGERGGWRAALLGRLQYTAAAISRARCAQRFLVPAGRAQPQMRVAELIERRRTSMNSDPRSGNPRRRALLAGAVCVASMIAGRAGLSRAGELKPTTACADSHDATPRQMEGPFFKPRSPERTSLLESGLAGTRIVVSGQVLSTRCQPVPGALLDFWQCDSRGDYDNRGNTLRGHQFADAQG